MGTHSLTFVYEDDEPVVNLYRHYDGYPSVHGAELAEFLDTKGRTHNGGMACLAAQMVAHFKTGPYNFYLYPVGHTDCGQDYEYHLYLERVVVKNQRNNTLFDGTWAAFAEFCSLEELA